MFEILLKNERIITKQTDFFIQFFTVYIFPRQNFILKTFPTIIISMQIEVECEKKLVECIKNGNKFTEFEHLQRSFFCKSSNLSRPHWVHFNLITKVFQLILIPRLALS